ncbi:MAG: glycosyltransferase family 4 protein [Caldilineaceae bacterium]|nr:glycosyltransferase family 4 protein [Caldilineaceae bacterium]
MHIVFVMSSLYVSGGVMLVAEYANGLAARGHTVSLVTPAAAVAPEIAAMLAPAVTVIEATAPFPADRAPQTLWRLTRSLHAAIPACDVVIATHTPTVAPVRMCGRGRCRVRGWLYMDYPEMFRGRRLESFLLAQAPRVLDLILTISQPLTDYLAPRTSTPVYTIGAGLSRQEHFFDQPRLSQPTTGATPTRRVMYLGDDRPRKGLREFLDAADRVRDAIPGLHLVIASKTPCVIATQVPFDFHLHPDDAALSALYRSSDLFVSSSWGEGLGYPPLEAMACGTPVVLTDSSGVRDFAADGVNCLMVPPKDVPALAAAMQRVLTDPDLAARLAAGGRATAARYEWSGVIDRLEAALGAGPARA